MHCLINADIYLLISGQRTYFFDQRRHFMDEIERLTKLYTKYKAKKYEWKQKYVDQGEIFQGTVARLETEISHLREMSYYERANKDTQTDIDFRVFNQMQRDYDNVTVYKKLVYLFYLT